MPNAVTVEDVARCCGVSQFTVLKWIQQRRLTAHRTASGYRIPAQAFRGLLRDRGVAADPIYLASNGSRQRVLIVAEREQAIASVMRELSSRTVALDVASATDVGGLECQLVSFHPDLIVLDTALPNLDVVRFCRRLKRRKASRHIKILAISNGGPSRAAERLVQAGADAVLAHLTDPSALQTAIQGLIDSPPTAERPG
jgi:excisionase family DNA binding protein